jgi:hypothetical protein
MRSPARAAATTTTETTTAPHSPPPNPAAGAALAASAISPSNRSYAMPDTIHTPTKDPENQRVMIEREIKERDAVIARLQRQKEEALKELTLLKDLIKEHQDAQKHLRRHLHHFQQPRRDAPVFGRIWGKR